MEEDKTPYKGFNCAYYDELELLALRGKFCEIVYTNGDETLKIEQAKIKTLFTKEKIEYLKLEDGQTIRLDHLKRINNQVF